jgi:hypothetical protein
MLMVNQLVGFGVAIETAAAKSVTYSDNGYDETDRTVYTFTAKAIGPAATDRRVHVYVASGNGGVTLSSLTVGGVTATINIQGAGSSQSYNAIATAAVPSGTTADIVVTWSAGQTRTGIIVWYSTGLTSETALATASTNTDGGTMTLAGSIAGGFAIGGAFENGGTPSMNWGGSPAPTEDVDTNAGTTILLSGCHLSTTGSGQAIIPDWSATPNGLCALSAAF